MTKSEFELISKIGTMKEKPISALDLEPHLKDRTLLYGYTCNRETFHVYLKNMKIYVVVYNNDYSGEIIKPINMRRIVVNSNHDYVPDKRLYPERCDYIFCQRLRMRDIELPFTSWNNSIETKDFYGFTLEDTVRQLRELTMAGMMDCKKALEATDYNVDKAIEYLRIMPLARPMR